MRYFPNSVNKWKIYLALVLGAAYGCIIFSCNNKDADTGVIRDVDYNFDVRPILADKCFKCHGPDGNKREAGLRFDTPEGPFAELEESPGKFAVVPGDLINSQLYYRIYHTDSEERMPPPESNLHLTDYEKSVLKAWIQQGAEYKPHWAFSPPRRRDHPVSLQDDWPKNDIDYFILEKLEVLTLEPNGEADRERLLKRVSYDLTGLPPSIELQERFLNDKSEDAFEKIVDELLRSPHYGEKMAVHWLDVARYADSHGYQDDGLRTMWPWRDWVIHAFNENYPFDRFITWQLAGDLMADPTKEMLLATGFNRNHKITQEGGVIDEEYRIEYVTDRTNTFAKAFLGLTFECAKCHDHKYDPVSQKEYYSTFAFFNQVPEKGIFGTIDASFADPPNMRITSEDRQEILQFINLKDTAVEVMIMKDSAKVRPTYVLNRGLYDAPTDPVDFSTPGAVLPFDTSKYSKDRLGLAQWLLDEKNPLTARVFVNRIWQEIFGRGFVRTSGDFGMQGELPSHLELLDWLATDFRENGWDIKLLVKNIVMSATYRQSSETTAEKLEKDPENTYLSRAPRIRFAAEMVRDHVLASSGLLNSEIGGASVKTYQPGGIWELSTSGRGVLQRYIQDSGDKLYRRGMYQFIKRTVPPPVMLMFDASNRDQCEVRRVQTNTPLQALAMMNDEHVLEASRVLSEKLMLEYSDLSERIGRAFRQIVCRKPRSEEMELLTEFFQEEKMKYQELPEEAEKLLNAGEFPRQKIDDAPSTAALMQVVHMIYNMDESITKS